MPEDRARSPAGGPLRRGPLWTTAVTGPYRRPPPAPAASSGTARGESGQPFWFTVLSAAALASAANTHTLPPIQPSALGWGTNWAPPPPPQELPSAGGGAAAVKKKGGSSKRKERKYTIEQMRGALYAAVGAAARGAPAVAPPPSPAPAPAPAPSHSSPHSSPPATAAPSHPVPTVCSRRTQASR